MKISIRLILGFLIVASLIGAVGWYSLYANQQLAESFDVLKEYQRKVRAAAEASSYAKRAETHLFLYLMLHSEIDKEKFFQRHASLEDQIAILEKEVVLSNVSERVNVLKTSSADILNYGNQLLQLHDGNPEAFDSKDHTELIGNFDASSSAARQAGVTIVDLETSALNQDIDQSTKKAAELQQSLIVVMLFVIILALGIGFFVARSILIPIRKLRDAAIEIGKGKVGTQIKLQSRDAIGDLANAFNVMSSELKEAQEQLEQRVKERTRELKETQEQLLKSERMATIGELAAMVGHDLRNPLTGIKGATYYLKTKYGVEIDAKGKEMLKVIDLCIDYSNKIIDDLLEYSREMKLDLGETNPKKLLRHAMSMLRIPRNIQVTNAAETEPKIIVDKAKINRVFVNIIKNAFDAMPKGGTLTITSKAAENDVAIAFTDTGVGMSKETLSELGSPLFTTKAKGMGFGLSICKRIVDAHGGKISVESIIGKGTTITVMIPINPVASTENAEASVFNGPEVSVLAPQKVETENS